MNSRMQSLPELEAYAVKPDGERRAWDRQPGEVLYWYNAFMVYRGLGHERTVKAAFQILCPLNHSRRPVPSVWEGNSSRFKWVERAAAWDSEILAKANLDRDDYLHRQTLATQEALAIAAEQIRDVLKEDGIDGLKKIAPKFITLFGKGGAGGFLLDGHKAMFGEKQEVSHRIKLEFKDFGPPTLVAGGGILSSLPPPVVIDVPEAPAPEPPPPNAQTPVQSAP